MMTAGRMGEGRPFAEDRQRTGATNHVLQSSGDCVPRDGESSYRRRLNMVVRLTTVLAQRAEDSAGRAAWFPGSFASVVSVRYRIPEIDETCASSRQTRPSRRWLAGTENPRATARDEKNTCRRVPCAVG